MSDSLSPDCSNSPDSSRRRVVGALTGAALALASLKVSFALAQAGSAQPVSASDPLAKALGYTDDSAKVDKAKFPTFKAGQKCSLCRFYQGDAGKQNGPCQIFSGKVVNANGWCSSFNAKT
jgi:hypothetical protein